MDFSIGKHFDDRYFNDPILGNVGACGFKIKKAKRISKVQFHN
jgi:hypothetical protein